MSAQMNADVVNALLTPILEVLWTGAGLRGQVGRLELVSQLPPPPGIYVYITVQGRMFGPVVWTFDTELAETITANMLSVHRSTIDAEACADAVKELSNMMLGNATDALLMAGLPVELSPPQATIVHDGVAPLLPRRTLSIPIQTSAGQVQVLLGLLDHDVAAAV